MRHLSEKRLLFVGTAIGRNLNINHFIYSCSSDAGTVDDLCDLDALVPAVAVVCTGHDDR